MDGGAGDDAILIDGLSADGHFNVHLGEGANDLALKNLDVGAAVMIAGGDGDDFVSIDGIAAGSLAVRLLGGNDTLNLEGFNADETNRARIQIDVGRGSDAISLANVTAGNVHVLLGDGGNTLSARSVDATRLQILGGKGKDSVSIDHSMFEEVFANYLGVIT